MMAFENIESTNPLTLKDNSVPHFGFQRAANTPDLMLNIYVQHYQHLQDKLKKLISQKEEIDREIQRRKDVEASPIVKPSNSLFFGLPSLLSAGSSPLALKFDYTNPEFISANFKDYMKSTSSFSVKTEVVVPKVETKRHLPLEELEEVSLEKKIKYECKSESIPQGSGSDSERSEKSTHKPQQSKWKNFPGHIMFAIKKGCQSFFDSEKGIRLACIHKILEQEPEYQHKFLQFIEKYKGVWKTYRTIAQYIKDEGDDKIHSMLMTMISELLLDENNKDFEEWLEETRMTEKTKQSIQKGKAVVRKEFLTRLQ